MEVLWSAKREDKGEEDMISLGILAFCWSGVLLFMY